MDIWQAVVLGFVQGLTEFLPVSSSGHLALVMNCFGISDILFISIILHLGTLVAVCVVFWRDILELFKKPFKTLGYLIIATIPAAIIGLLLDDLVEEYILGGTYFGIIIAVFFLITATVLFITEQIAKKRKNDLPLCFKTVIPMGLAQAVAILPGISRSGSTICAGTIAGGKSGEVAKFSFLMSIPVILGSFVVELYKGIRDGTIAQNFAEGGVAFGWSVALGFIVSAISGLFAIRVMLKAIQKANYKWFSLYLVLLAVTCVILQFTYFKV